MDESLQVTDSLTGPSSSSQESQPLPVDSDVALPLTAPTLAPAPQRYFNVLMLWNEVKMKVSVEGVKRFKLDTNLVDAFLCALMKGKFFNAVMQVVEKSQEMKIFVDKGKVQASIHGDA
ncbi:unnamed protein product [Fraxinus pennsylvanica]|uniref:Uncharacterized protein n=1 Tax=Fraxinus pennsylvanica TaxID=56036 RepID=A0AAD1ZHA8_9LAMI|nr:unnamed protein product [Fraxinus pennsylvanica]